MNQSIKRMISMLLCVAMLLSYAPPIWAAESASDSSAGISGLSDDVEYVSLPITIRDFAADGMLFEFNQINQSSTTYTARKAYTFLPDSLGTGFSWSSNDNLGFRIRTYAVHGSALPYANEWWYCVICNSDGSIKKILSEGTNSKTEYATYMTSGCFSVWLWIADGTTEECAEQHKMYEEFKELVNDDTKHRYRISYDASTGAMNLEMQYKELNGKKYILGDNNAFTLLLTDESDYINNLSGDNDHPSIAGTKVVQSNGSTAVSVELNSGAPQTFYRGNVRLNLVAPELDADKKPVYTQATVDYLAELLSSLLDSDQVPYTVKWNGETYYTGYYILGTNLFDENYNYVGHNSDAAIYGLADVFRASINGGLGTYSNAKERFDTGKLNVPTDIRTYYEAAYYLLHSLWRDNATESYSGNDGYGWNTWNYNKIHLVQTENAAGQKCYVFNSGYDNTAYDPITVVDGVYTGSGAIYNTQVQTITGAKESDGSTAYSNGVILPEARFDPLGVSGSGKSFGYGMDAGTYCKLTGVYPSWGEEFYPNTNYHLTLEGHAKFIYYKDANQYFTFTGDDDVYLYINGKRVMDLGGAHSLAQVSINLNDVATLCGLSDGMTYDFDFFYMERHGTAANFGIETNIQIVDPSMLTTKTGYQNGVNTGYNGYVNPDMPVVYEFALENDGEAGIQNLTFVDPTIGVALTKDTVSLNSLTTISDLSVTLYSSDGNVKSSVAAGSLTEEGLKQYLAEGLLAGEKIVIHGFSYKIGNNDWQRRQLADESYSNWYFYNVVYTTADSVEDNSSVRALSGTANWVVQQLQEEQMGTVSITKLLDEDSGALADRVFTVQVLLDGKPVPAGTAYAYTDESGITEYLTVQTAGQILLKVGTTVKLRAASGTTFEVKELIAQADREAYRATYRATNATVSDAGVTGTVTGDTEAAVTVINHIKPGSLMYTNKYVTATDDPNKFTLTLESYVEGQLTMAVANTPTDFVLVLDQSASMYAPAGDANGYDNAAIIGTLSSSVAVDSLSTEKAQHAGYYIAQSYSGRPVEQADGSKVTYYDWFLVQYLNGKWYYVRKDKTAMPATLDPNYAGDTNAIGATLVRDTPITTFNYYQSGYGALYDAVTGFVNKLEATGVDHRVAVVGFASPCYDAMEYFDGSGVYVNGEYYLYDAEYFTDANGYYTYRFGDDTKTKIYLTAAQVAALNKKDAKTVYDQALVSVKTNAASVEASLNAVTTNYWHTCPAAGLDMANQIFAATPSNGRNRTVLLFTDGEPTVRLGADFLKSEDWTETADGLYVANTYWTVAEGKDSAIEQAYITKNTYGAKIHTIGTAGAGADTLFLQGVSSDYPNATYYPTTFIDENGDKQSFADDNITRQPTEAEIRAGMGDPIADPMYAHFTGINLSLEDIFGSILQSQTTLDLGADAVLKEVLTDYFDLESGTVADISVYTAPYNGTSFGEKTKLESAKVTLSSSDGTERLDTVEVTGFDYGAEYISAVPRQDANGNDYYGSKLIVEVKIKTRDGFWGGNNVPTNEDTTGIYEHDGTPVDRFPEPQVNVPLSLTLKSDNAVVYYGSDALPGGLLAELKAGGLDVVINPDGTLAPKAEWMDDFATLTWTGSAAPNGALSCTENGEYTYAAVLTPNTDGSTNTCTYPSNMAGDPVSMSGLTAQDKSAVEILIPAIPFRDSTITRGEMPSEAYFNQINLVSGGIQWVLMDDISATKTATHGTAPTLRFTYEPHTENGTYVEATAVDVTVSAQYGESTMDFTDVSYFGWYACTNDSLHDEGTISLHKGDVASQNEFWIHVADTPESSLVTDKYVTPTEDPNEFELTLEAYAKGTQETVTVTKPADIVLVLDHSGSMRTPAGATEVLESGTLYTGGGEIPRSQISVEKAKHRGYYVAQSKVTNNWFVMEYVPSFKLEDGTTAARWVGYLVPSTESIVDPTEGNYTEHTKTLSWVPGSVDENLVFYKSQYAVLYDALMKFVEDLKATGVEHNVAIVGFAGSEGAGTRLYVGAEGSGNSGYKNYKSALYHENTTQERREELYQLAMKNVQDATEYQQLLSNIELIETNHSYTCPTAGLQLANEVFAANAVKLAERDRIVVLFTDGIPNCKLGEEEIPKNTEEDTNRQSDIYNEVVRKAYESKKTYGARVYSICTTTVTGSKDFLNFSSSNYPNAVSFATPGTQVSDKYFHEIDGLDMLNSAFSTITQSTSSTTVTLDETAVLRDVLSDYFNLENGTVEDISVYTQPYNGDGTWGELDPFTAEEGMKIELSSSDGSGRLDVIEVSGFDYHDEYVSTTARDGYYGSRLVVKVRIKVREGFLGGLDVPTNDASTGIYSPDGIPVEEFPVPEVDIAVIVPDTVVIDFGLPVVIDPLANDPWVYTTAPVLTGIGAKDAVSFSTEEIVGEFGMLTIKDGKVYYTPSNMQMNKEDVFTYSVTYYGEDGKILRAQSTITVIPATTIYYEDSFVDFTVWNASDFSLNEDADRQWKDDGSVLNRNQNQDRPGVAGTTENNTPASIDADKIYGNDGAYTGMATYSMGSAKKVTVNKDLFAEAQFTFYGTGFDIVSLTSNTTGTILVDVYKTSDFINADGTNNYSAEIQKSFMVDTYYGYKYAPNGEWVVDPDATNTLYQVPVMKVSGLEYGQYTAVISVAYKEALDHQNKDGQYDFYLDAIRIYDPANDGATSETVKDAYVADGEGWPEYFELRNLIISKKDFNSTVTGTGNGIVFIDNSLDTNNKVTYSIEDYTNFGPNNEVYLAPGQSVAFQLAIPDNVAGIHLAMKSVGGTANVKVYDAADATHTSVTPTTIATATDLYYDITSLNNKTVVIANTGESGDAILSITNVKVTYETTHEDSIEEGYFPITQEEANAAVASVMMLMRRAPMAPDGPESTEPETTVPETTVPETTVPETTVPEVTEPEATEPEATEPEATEPEATEPEATEPEVTEPEATEPEATEPEVTEPEATEPEVTEPEATEPEATEPEITEPEVTEPETTEPSDPTEESKPAETVKPGAPAEDSTMEATQEAKPGQTSPGTGNDFRFYEAVAMMLLSLLGMMLTLAELKRRRNR